MLYLVGSNKDCNDSEKKQRKYDRRGKRKRIVQWDKRKAPGRSMEKVVMGEHCTQGPTSLTWRTCSIDWPADFENGNQALSPTSISMTDNSNSPLASLFKPSTNAWASWSKLVDHHAFSQLHSKFWGEKIEDEAQDWRISHPDVKDDDDDDITSGCYALHLGVELTVAKLWVRKDYIRIYDYCNERYTKSLTAKIQYRRRVLLS